MSNLDGVVVVVTGATGFIASHVVQMLLAEGAKVRATVRDAKNEEKVKFLRELVPDAKHELEFVEADLLQEDSWPAAVKGAKYVIHVASPFPASVPSHPDDLLKPAVEGTKAVLKACAESGTVKRVVVTSSVAAVYDASLPYPKDNAESKTFNEECWTDVDDVHLDAYAKSKALAEKAAWDFVKELSDDKKFELVTINPGMVLGPLLNKSNSTSIEVVKRLLNHEVPMVAKLYLNVTDVRDVAAAHIKGLKVPEAAGHRHLIVSKPMWMKELAGMLSKEFKSQGYHVPNLVAPNFFVWMNSFLDKTYRLIVPRLGREYKYENKRMLEVLGLTPTEIEKTVADTGNSLISYDLVKKPKKKEKKVVKESADDSKKAGEEKGDEVKKATEPEKNGTEAPAPASAAPQEA